MVVLLLVNAIYACQVPGITLNHVDAISLTLKTMVCVSHCCCASSTADLVALDHSKLDG